MFLYRMHNAGGLLQVWIWQDGDGAMEKIYDVDTFRNMLRERHINAELRPLLPRPEGTLTETPAEAALRGRMCDPWGIVRLESN